MNVFNLFASLKLDKTDYEKGIDEAKKEGNDFADTTQSKISPKAVAAFAAIAVAVVGVSKEIYNLARQSLNYADNIGDLAAKFGVSTEAISEMQYIASQTGSDIGTLTSSMSMLYMRAKQDGEAFQELGVSVKDSQGNFKAMDELFWETVGAMNSLESEGEKSAYMLDLFGRSASSIGELLRKDTDEINAMRQEAHDLGIVLDQETTDFAGGFFDKLDGLKQQGQSALALLISGDEEAEEKLQNFFDNVMEMLDGYLPAFVNFGVRLLIQTALAMVRIAPSLAVEIIDAIIDTIFSVNWFQVGVNIAMSIVEGIVNIVGSALGWLGIDVPKVDFGIGDTDYFAGVDKGGEYEISENIKQDISVKVEASGDTTVSQETAEKTAEALAPYIDKILGGK